MSVTFHEYCVIIIKSFYEEMVMEQAMVNNIVRKEKVILGRCMIEAIVISVSFFHVR